jgi:RNA polymerase-binding protein DksA
MSDKKTKKPELYAPSDKEYFRKIIEDKIRNLLKELGYLKERSLETTLAEYSGDYSTYSFHMADQGTDAQEREKAFMFAHREGRFLNHLTRALDRIKDGTYGYCAECGKAIPKKRLEAVPHATLCIECKSSQEEK